MCLKIHKSSHGVNVNGDRKLTTRDEVDDGDNPEDEGPEKNDSSNEDEGTVVDNGDDNT